MHLAGLPARRALRIENKIFLAEELQRLLVDTEHELAAALGHRVEASGAINAWIERAVSVLFAADHL